MEVGRQFDNTRPLPSFKTYHYTCRQAMHITQFYVCYQGIIVGHADFHRLTGKIPVAVSLDMRSK